MPAGGQTTRTREKRLAKTPSYASPNLPTDTTPASTRIAKRNVRGQGARIPEQRYPGSRPPVPVQAHITADRNVRKALAITRQPPRADIAAAWEKRVKRGGKILLPPGTDLPALRSYLDKQARAHKTLFTASEAAKFGGLSGRLGQLEQVRATAAQPPKVGLFPYAENFWLNRLGHPVALRRGGLSGGEDSFLSRAPAPARAALLTAGGGFASPESALARTLATKAPGAGIPGRIAASRAPVADLARALRAGDLGAATRRIGIGAYGVGSRLQLRLAERAATLRGRLGTPVGQLAREATAGGRAATTHRALVAARRIPGRSFKLAAAGTLAAQTPAYASTGDLGALTAPLAGKGVLAEAAKRPLTADNPIVNIAANLAKDVLGLPAAVVPSTYMIAHALVLRLQGHPEALHQLIASWKATDAFGGALSGASVGEIIRRFEEHPLYTFLEGRGVYTGQGYVRGRLAERGSLGPEAQRFANTPREDLLGTAGYTRPRSRIYGTARRQARADAEANRVLAKVGEGKQLTWRESLTYHRARAEQAVIHRHIVTHAKGAEQRQQAETALALENLLHEAEQHVAPGLEYATVAAVERIVRPEDFTHEGLTKIIDHYEHEGRLLKADKAHPDLRAHNDALVHSLRELRAQLGTDAAAQVQAAVPKIAGILNDQEHAFVALDLIDPRQAAARRNLPEAIIHQNSIEVAAKDRRAAAREQAQPTFDAEVAAKTTARRHKVRINVLRAAAARDKGVYETLAAEATRVGPKEVRGHTVSAADPAEWRAAVRRRKAAKIAAGRSKFRYDKARAKLPRLEKSAKDAGKLGDQARADIAKIRHPRFEETVPQAAPPAPIGVPIGDLFKTDSGGRFTDPLAQAIEAADSNLAPEVRYVLAHWLVSPEGIAPEEAAVLEAAYGPIKAALKQRYGDTVTLYRGQKIAPADAVAREYLSYTADRDLAVSFARGKKVGHVVESHVPVDRILAITTGQANTLYNEFLIRVTPDEARALIEGNAEHDLIGRSDRQGTNAPTGVPTPLDQRDSAYINAAPRARAPTGQVGPSGLRGRRGVGTPPHERYTGESARRGTSPRDFARVLHTALVRGRLIIRQKYYDEFVNREQIGVEHASRADAEANITPEDRAAAPPVAGGGENVIVIRKNFAHNVDDAYARMHEGDGAPEDIVDAGNPWETARGEASGDKTGPWIKVSKANFDLARKLDEPIPEWQQGLTSLGQLFKRAVLPWSPSWYWGNAIDNSIRAMVNGQLPVGATRLGKAYGVGKRAQEDLMARDSGYGIAGTGVYGEVGGALKGQDRLDYARRLESNVDGIRGAIDDIRRASGIRVVPDAVHKANNFLLRMNADLVEHPVQQAALGKIVTREIAQQQRLAENANRSMEQAYTDWINGHVNSRAQAALAKQVEAIFGNWVAAGPATRSTLAAAFPFLMWLRAASRFVFITLPRDHPTFTGIQAAAATMTQRERDALGLDLWTPREIGGALPSYRQQGLPLSGGRLLPTVRWTSFGVFSSQSPLADVTTFMFPFISDIGNVADLGVDWKGDKLTNKNGEPNQPLDNAKALLFVMGDSFIPGLAIGRRVLFGRGRYDLGGGHYSSSQKKLSLLSTLWHEAVPPSKITSDKARKAAISKRYGIKGGGGSSSGGRRVPGQFSGAAGRSAGAGAGRTPGQ